jgi:uncharacterized protein YfdQ (DUF2303 family)
MSNPDTIHAAIEAGKALTILHQVKGYKPVVTAPFLKDGSAILVPEKLDAPRYLTARPVFNDTAAFIAYVNSFKFGSSRIFYTQEGHFTAVIDYHDAGGLDRAFGDHLAILSLKRSPEWEVWRAKSEEQMAQQQFAEFIEDNLRDILTPDPAKMMQVATGLHATVGATFRQATNQANGSALLQWDEQVQGTVSGSQEEIPTTFSVGLRPFMGTERYPVDCRLRYRVNGGSLRLHYKALHLDPITEAALDGIVAKVRDETGIMPALGAHDPSAFARGI